MRRSTGRFYLTSGPTTFPVGPSANAAQFIGPALAFPVMDPTLSLRIIHAFANISEAAATNSLLVNNAVIAVVAVGPVGLFRVRIYRAQSPTLNALGTGATPQTVGVEGFWFGMESPEIIRGSDYRELSTQTNPPTMGAFQLRLEFELSNTAAIAKTANVNFGVLFEMFQENVFGADS